MDAAQLKCPGCSQELLAGTVDGHRQYLCEHCHSAVFTIAVLRQLEGPLAQKLWTAPEVPGASPGPCPFCSQPMANRASTAGHVAVCRPCEVLWFDQEAYQSLPGKSQPSEPGLASEALRCPQCGAPFANSWQENCTYCSAALHTPTKVVVMPAPSSPPTPRLGLGGSLLGSVVEGLMEDI